MEFGEELDVVCWGEGGQMGENERLSGVEGRIQLKGSMESRGLTW